MCLWAGMQLWAPTAANKNSHLQLPRGGGNQYFNHMKVHENMVVKSYLFWEKLDCMYQVLLFFALFD